MKDWVFFMFFFSTGLRLCQQEIQILFLIHSFYLLLSCMPMEWSEGKVAFIQQGKDESPGLFTVHHCAHAMMTWCFSVLTAEQKLPQVELHLSAALPAGLWSYLSNDCIREVELHLTTMRIYHLGKRKSFFCSFKCCNVEPAWDSWSACFKWSRWTALHRHTQYLWTMWSWKLS